MPRGFHISKILLVIVVAVLCAHRAEALDVDKSLSQYVHQSYGLESGLPQISALALAQTTDGYIWVGTQEGLVRFDGVEFTTYNGENTNAFKDDSISALIPDLEGGGLWIASYSGGLLHYEKGEFLAIPAAPELPDPRITCMTHDVQGRLWLGTPSGLAQLVGGKVAPVTGKDAPSQINALLVLPSGGVLVGAEDGIYLYEEGAFINLSKTGGAPATAARSLCLGAAGAAWIGTDAGLFGYANLQFSERALGDLGSLRINTVIEDRDGGVWIGTESHGVHVLRGEALSSYPESDARGKLQIAALLEDREHNLWVGTHNEGLKILRDGTVTVFSQEEGLPTRMTLALVDDMSGGIWVGSPSGLSRISPDGAVSVFTKADGLPSDFVISLTRAASGELWVGTRNSGLARFALEQKEDQKIELVRQEFWSTAQGLKSDAIYGIYEDYESTLWVGTNGGGLHKIKDGTVSNYSKKDGLTDDKVTSILRDRNGDLWVGTDFGLDRFVGAQFENHVKVSGFEGLRIMSMYLDPEDNLWIATYGKGLRVIHNDKTAAVNRKDGLFDNVVYILMPDAQDNFWMTSNNGLGKLSRREALDFIKGKIPKIHCEVFGAADGMRSREGLGSFMQPGWVTKDGLLWFATMDGVIRVDPATMQGKDQPPLVSVQWALADGARFKPEAALPSGVRLVEFKYTGLGFYAPQRMEFEYRLKGFEDEWHQAGRRRSAYYTNLSPGKYTFEVMAKGRGGATSPKAGSLPFEVKAAVYQTVWFYLLCALVLGIGLFLLLRQRTLQVKRREILTTKLAWTRAQSVLETQVEAIRSLGEILGKAIERVNNHMNDLARAASEMAHVVVESENTVREVGEAGISVERNADEIVSEVRKSEKVSSAGRITMLETAAAIDRMRDDAAEVTRSGSSLMDSLTQVDRTISSVKEIAEKSKILAINASIEAVKAGRAGAGFGVVAREIKAMALQSKSATLQITTLLNMVRKAIAEITVIGKRSQDRTVSCSRPSPRSAPPPRSTAR
ncbi:MAG: methyl-accepting chemotaxis protein [Myxococcota bacterium]|nr:methyl-accepting chemotaxis protein [Myxococcota bacterium]